MFLLVTIFTVKGVCQQMISFNITQQQGLPSNTVYDIFQDSKGFLWVATENGLARYNGASFRRYTNTEIRSTAMSSLLEDDDGRIWLHNFFGEIVYVEHDTLKKLHSWEERYSEGFPCVVSLGDTLLISSTKHLFYYTPKEDTWSEVMPLEKSPNYNHITTQNGIQWLCYSTSEFVYVVSTKEPHLPHYQFDKKNYNLNNNVVRLVTWRGELWMFDAVSHSLFELSKGTIHDISANYETELIGTRQIENIGDSLLVFVGSNGAHIITKQNKRQHVLADKNVSCATADEEGGLWIGTLNEGMFYFPSAHSFLYPKERYGLYTKLIADKNQQRIAAGSYFGKTDFFSFGGSLTNSLLSSNGKEVQSLFVDTLSQQLYVFTNTLRSYSLATLGQTNEQAIAAVKEITRVGEQLALATSAGLYLYHPITKQRQILYSPQRITTVAYDCNTSILWVGTQKGLFQYNTITSQSTTWSSDSTALSPGASKLRVLENGTIVIGTHTNGLYFVRNDKVLHHFTIQNGLPSNRITSLSDNGKTVWVGTDKGIFQIDLTANKISILDRTKGLAADEVYDLLFINNQLWVSHPSGLQVFKALQSINTQAPVLHLQSIVANNKSMQNIGDAIILNPSSQQLMFEFDVSNNLKSRGATVIEYRIKEIDKDDWHTTTLQNPIVNYLALPYGELTFEARAINEDGVTSIDTVHISLKVQAPFWKQWWFLGILFTLSVCLIVLLFYLRLKKTAEKNRLHLQQINQQQELRIARLTSIRAQMNPHFIFNTMSLIQGNVLNGLKEDANRNIQNFSLLVRKVLDFSSKEMIALQEEIDVLEKYLSIEKDRFNGSLDFRINLDENLKQEMIRIPSLITQPFVENALRHGLMHKEGLKTLRIDFSLNNDCLLVSIDDNGIGRKSSAEFNKARKPEHNSFAVEAYQKRIELLNTARVQKIVLEIIDKHSEHGIATGTTVLIYIPMER
jgi:ligand-binding sensor domain-containing protein